MKKPEKETLLGTENNNRTRINATEDLNLKGETLFGIHCDTVEPKIATVISTE